VILGGHLCGKKKISNDSEGQNMTENMARFVNKLVMMGPIQNYDF